MPRAPIHSYWQDRIKVLAEAEKSSLSVEAIVASLGEQTEGANEALVGPLPSERTVARYVRTARKQSKEERLPYQAFAWPESMDSEALPWEASRACLDLVAHIRDEAQDGYQPPLVGLVREFWKATQAAPDADVRTRLEIAERLYFKRTEGLERYLAHRGWLKDEQLPPLCFTEEELRRGDTFDILASAYRMSPATRREAAERKTKEQGGK